MRLRHSSHPTSFFGFAQWLLLLLAVLMMTRGAALSQIDRAVLEGTVTDPTGAAIVGASVKTVAVDTGITQEQRTNSRGYYRFPGLAVGRYTVSITNEGFKTRVVQDVILQVGQTRTLDTKLEVGAIAEKSR